MSPRRAPLSIGGTEVAAGRKAVVELPIARLFTGTLVSLPVIAMHGTADGPTIWLSGAIHGDEICGVEIIRQVMAELTPRKLRGTVLAVPVVNVHGFNTADRYLPDRRDLNRSFPGSAKGSLAARIAHLMMSEVIARCSVGIDLHTGSDHRSNMPHLRADLTDEATLDLATAFAPPVALHARTRDGSLRAAATEAGARVLLFEGGEAQRFDAAAIEVGRVGVLRVLHLLGMREEPPPPGADEVVVCSSSRWVRASASGILHLQVERGDHVEVGQPLAIVMNTFGRRLSTVKSRDTGIVIANTEHPLVNRGDAVVHVANVGGLMSTSARGAAPDPATGATRNRRSRKPPAE